MITPDRHASETDDRPLAERTRAAILDIADFPRAGILFRDITPLLGDAALLDEVLAEMTRPFATCGVTHVLGIESRGFLFGVPIAQRLRLPFVPARKPGKLPRATVSESFALEYGSDSLSVHADAIGRDCNVLIVDDVLATGGTAAAAIRLVERLGARVAGLSMLSELTFLNGRAMLGDRTLHSVVQY